MNRSEIIYLVIGVLIAIFGALVPLFRKLVKRSETTIDDNILELSIKAVEFVDRHFIDKSGKSKKALATELVERGAKEIGKEISEEMTDKVIEKAWAMKEINGALEKEVDKGK